MAAEPNLLNSAFKVLRVGPAPTRKHRLTRRRGIGRGV